MTDIERITHYETLLDAVTEASEELSRAIEVFRAAQSMARELEAYYEGGLWRRDLEADEAGLLPPTLKRGVLSEDAVYNALMENARLAAILKGAEDLQERDKK